MRVGGRRIPLAGAAIALGALVAAPAHAPAMTPTSTSGELTFTGFGVGGGSGASQFGEIGYASVGQDSYQAILAHFYGGTTLTTAADQAVRVWITEANGGPVVVFDPSGLSVGGVSVGANVPVELTDQGGTMVAAVGQAATGCGSPGGWSNLTSAPGSLWVSPPSLPPVGQQVDEPASSALVWCGPGGSERSYRGQLEVLQDGSGQMVLVNELGLESYVLGVVANEMPASWGLLGASGPQGEPWGFQALEAQAVEARTYALAVGNGYGFATICDTSACQVYGGVNNGLSAPYRPLVEQAVADTAHEVLVTASGAPAFTQYSASDGGYTAPGTFPAVPDPYDAGCYGNICNPWNPWTQSVSLASVEAAFPSIGTPTGLAVDARNGLGNDGGRVTSITVSGTNGSVTVSGATFAGALGLPSAWFVASGPIAISNDASASAPAPPPTPPESPSLGNGVLETTPAGTVVAADGATSLGDTATLGITGLGGSHPLAAPVVGITRDPSGQGYWLVAADGGVFGFGDAPFFGNTYTLGITGLGGSHPLAAPVVGLSPTPDGQGYWLVAADGGVFSFGDAGFYGNTYTRGFTGLGGAHPLPARVVALVPTPDGKGYWLALANGTVLAFGDATNLGGLPAAPASPIVAMLATPDGQGYWLLAADGTVYGFGDAPSYGSLTPGTASAIGLVPGPGGQGYSIVLSSGALVGFDGGVSIGATAPAGGAVGAIAAVGTPATNAQSATTPTTTSPTTPAPPSSSPTGNVGLRGVTADGTVVAADGATSLGDTATLGITGLGGSHPLAAPVVGLSPTPDGQGYWLVAADGGVFGFGDAPFFGNTYTLGLTGLGGSHPLAAPVVGLSPTPDGQGYWLVAADGGVFGFGDAPFFGNTYTLGLTGLGGSHPLAAPVVGLSPTPDGQGYWLVAADGGVFGFGDAHFYGNTYSAGYSGLGGSHPLPAPVVTLVPTADGQGYWLVLANGDVFAFGDASDLASADVGSATVVSAARAGAGLELVLSSGAIVGLGGAPSAPAPGGVDLVGGTAVAG
ncbi:SpoIID/LytB domain protein [Acidimicrobium ferrooxidans DSM 10331]|uniref:SpoIID/LytB domain protein n=1 Tax=Acidimicrobium ferrooxidans (strain DSM 10331 / JCM 15462 / NBRC 103882 / ICP) TaxID=525909 RepID=C7M100_ACIFD|nr:SpoIID/LytB domain-containing protein [Acidimicrobium ferrooxidans]ACU54658.1 SpoIID/LytB domain protein [Acidimicrobium ferrooxidans DSM 10331]